MKRNFYLQHPLMAMYDPRMQTLLDKEGPKGNRSLLDHHRKTEPVARLPSKARISASLLQGQKAAVCIPEENHLRIPTFHTRRRRILQSRRTESGEKEGEKNGKK